MALRDEFRQRQHRPTLAARAVRAKLVRVVVQSGDAAQVDNWDMLAGRQAHQMSLAGAHGTVDAAVMTQAMT